MRVMKLTKRVVDTLQAEAKRVIYYDAELKGFGLKVTHRRKELVRRIPALQRRTTSRQAPNGSRVYRQAHARPGSWCRP